MYDRTAHAAATAYTADGVGNPLLSWQWRLGESGSYSRVMPQVTEAGRYTLHYIVTAPNYWQATGSVTITVTALVATVEVDGETPAAVMLETDATGDVTVEDGSNVGLNLNGNELTGDIVNGGSLTVTDTSENGEGIVKGDITTDGGETTITDATVKGDIITNGGRTEITGGIIEGSTAVQRPDGSYALYTDIAANYTVADKKAFYGEAIELEIGGNAHGAAVDYTLPTTAGVHKITISFAETIDHENALYYPAVQVICTVTIDKATPGYTVPENLTASERQTLSEIALPEGWSWGDSTLSVGKAGENTFTAVYTPKDTANYESVTAELTIAVKTAGLPLWVIVLTAVGIATVAGILILVSVKKKKTKKEGAQV